MNTENQNKKLGKEGEKKAVRYLKKKGYKILERNCVLPVGEIDIVAFDKAEKTVAFVEVKTGTSDFFANPSEKVDYKKQQKYRLLATEYMTSKDMMGRNARFDVIEIVGERIEHFIDAFR